jgi:hypothetical protein
MVKPEFKIFDPRRGEDWVETTRSGATVSTREQNLLLLRYTPGRKHRPFEPFQFDEFVRTSMLRTGALGYFSVSSLSGPLRAGLPPALEMIERHGSAMGYFPLEADIVDQYLGLKNAVSFEVVIVCSVREHLREPAKYGKTYPWDIDHILEQIESLGCLSRFDGDTETLEVFTRLYADIDLQIERFARQRST